MKSATISKGEKESGPDEGQAMTARKANRGKKRKEEMRRGVEKLIEKKREEEAARESKAFMIFSSTLFKVGVG